MLACDSTSPDGRIIEEGVYIFTATAKENDLDTDSKRVITKEKTMKTLEQTL